MVSKFGNSTGGFSFLELLISIGIFVVITTAVVFNFRAGERSDELRLAAEGLATELRSLYTKAQVGNRTEFNVRTVAFPGITITSQPAELILSFEPPEPRLLINGGEQEAEARIELTHEKTNQKKTVIIKRVSGRIEVE